MLKTEWKHWDKYFNHLVGKKIHILEIGVFRGEAMQWFIDNLMTNKGTTYTGVDTFGGSPEFFIYNKPVKIDFNDVKKECFSRVEKSDKKDQINFIIKNSKDALYQLYKDENKENYFDIIYIDASHEAIDVLSDCVLSWNVLKEGGLLINDDYYWDLLNQEYFRPKISIDSFINIYKSQCDVLHIGRQVILRKKMKSEFNTPRASPAVVIMHEIPKQNPENFILQLPPKKKEVLPFELTFMDEPNYTFYMDDKNIIKKINKLKENNMDKKILQNSYFCGFFNKDTENNFYNFYGNILKKDTYNSLSKFYLLNENKISLNYFEYFKLINTNYKDINFLTIKHKEGIGITHKKNIEKIQFSKNMYDYIKINKNNKLNTFTSNIIYPLNELNKNNINILTDKSHITMMDINKYNSYKLNNMNILDLNLYSRNIIYYNNIYNNNNILFEYIYTSLLMVIMGLIYNSKLGSSYYSFLDTYMDISIQIIEIIRNYYEDVQIINIGIDNKLRNNNYFLVKAEKFRGITKKDLKKLKDLLFEIKNKKKFFYLFNKNYFNKTYINNIINYNNTYTNNLVKYLTFINKLYNELNSKKISQFNITNIKKILLQTQLNYFLKYLGNNNLLNIL